MTKEAGKVAGIVAAAGEGTRMADRAGVRKQFRTLAGRPVYAWAVRAFLDSEAVDTIVVVTRADDVAAVQETLSDPAYEGKPFRVVAGGPSRKDSVAEGLSALDPSVEWVVVHDGVRPLVTPSLIDKVIAAAKETGAATAGVPLNDTVKVVDPGGLVEATLDRERLTAVQTPQAFSRHLLERAHREVKGGFATDDCALVEALGASVRVVPGERQNLKITTEEDWRAVNAWIGSPVTVTGFGFDVHRLAPDRPLILGGVRLVHERGLAGHSDADALTHAVVDAVLGAACLGDIGTHFPDTDETFRGADSLMLLGRVRERVEAMGGRVVHIDAFVSAERPRLGPYIPAMRENLARALGLDPRWVSVKAGTGEGSGPVGRQEVIEARAVATLVRPA